MPRIASYTVDDLPQVLELAKLMHAESRYAGMPFDEPTVREFLTHGVTNVRATAFVARHSTGSIIGFMGVVLIPYVFTPQFLATDTALYVKPEYRHTMAFAGLIIAAERWARMRGAHNMLLGVSAPKDVAKVCRAYHKLGYKDWGVMLYKEIS